MQTLRIVTSYYRYFQMASNNDSVTSSTLTPPEVELINRVHSHFPNNEPDKFHFFYQTASPFSNFHPCTFSEDGIEFTSSEQYMMHHKASKSSNILFFIIIKLSLQRIIW
jgi:hypothetical protein